MSDWQPKEYRRRAPHCIWYSEVCGGTWFVNYTGDEIHSDFKTWQEAMDFLCDELAKQQPMEVS